MSSERCFPSDPWLAESWAEDTPQLCQTLIRPCGHWIQRRQQVESPRDTLRGSSGSAPDLLRGLGCPFPSLDLSCLKWSDWSETVYHSDTVFWNWTFLTPNGRELLGGWLPSWNP